MHFWIKSFFLMTIIIKLGIFGPRLPSSVSETPLQLSKSQRCSTWKGGHTPPK